MAKWIHTTILFALGWLGPAFAEPSNKNIDAPDELGPYRIGFAEGVVSLPSNDGLPTTVRIWYPTTATGSPGTYDTTFGGVVVSLASKHGAIEGAPVAPGGPFPLVIDNHPGGSRNAGAYVVHNPLKEYLASHGFIVLSYMRVTGCANRIISVSRLIDKMTEIDAGQDTSVFPGIQLQGKVDVGRAGVMAFSGGGPELIAAGGGKSSHGVAPDPRVKAMAVVEISTNDAGCPPSLSDLEAITSPYLVVEGSAVLGPLQVAFFQATVHALPRIDVHMPGVVHLGTGGSGACHLIDQLREHALTSQLAGGTAVESLTDPLEHHPFTFTPGSTAFVASLFWNWDMPGILTPSNLQGGGRQFCNNVGLVSVKPLDNDGDGLTDSIPDGPFGCSGVDYAACYDGSVALAPNPAMPVAMTERLHQLYVGSFLKVFLAGDGRYDRYLNDGHASAQGLPSRVTKVD